MDLQLYSPGSILLIYFTISVLNCFNYRNLI